MSDGVKNQRTPKFGADSPEIADAVMNEHIKHVHKVPAGLIGWTAAAVAFVLVWGVTTLAVSAAIYGVWRMTRWIVS